MVHLAYNWNFLFFFNEMAPFYYQGVVRTIEFCSSACLISGGDVAAVMLAV